MQPRDAEASAPIQIAVRCVIGVLVARVVIAAVEPEASVTILRS